MAYKPGDPGSPPQVIELQMGNACGVLDVQLLAAKVRSEDSKLKRLDSAEMGTFFNGTQSGGEKGGGLVFCFLGGTGVFKEEFLKVVKEKGENRTS